MSKILSYIPKPIRAIMAFGLLLLLLGFLKNFGDKIGAFMAWYINFTYFGIGLNDTLSLIVKVFAWIIPVGCVVILRNSFEFKNSFLKGLVDFLSFSTTVVLSYLFKFFQEYFIWFFIVGTVLVVLLIVLFVLLKKKGVIA